MAKAPEASTAAAPVAPSALEKEPYEAPAPPGEGKKGRRGLEYYLGTNEGRSRLMLILWAVSLAVMGIGYALILWIWLHGGL